MMTHRHAALMRGVVGALCAAALGAALAATDEADTEARADESRHRLIQWRNLYGDLDTCVAAAETDPTLYELLALELELEPISGDARAIREAIGELEPAELAYGADLDRITAGIAGGELPPATTAAIWESRQRTVAARAAALQHWLGGVPMAKARTADDTDPQSVVGVYMRLGEPDDEKCRLVTATIEKLQTGDVERHRLESLQGSTALRKFADRIEMLDAPLWSFERNFGLLMASIGRRQPVGEWHDPHGPLGWVDGNPADLPSVTEAIAGLELWLAGEGVECASAEVRSRRGDPDAYREKIWLARCLLVTLRDNRDKYYRQPQTTAYGFRHDPMQFVEHDRTFEGAAVRTFVFERPADGDDAVIQTKIDEVLAEQREDGAFGESLRETGQSVLALLDLGLPRGRPEVQAAVAAMRRQIDAGGYEPPDPGDEGLLPLEVVQALCRLGLTDVAEAAATVRWYADNPDEWLNRGCPWGQSIILLTLWEGRGVAEVEPTLSEALSWVADNMNGAGCLSYFDPWSFVNLAGTIDRPLSRTILERQLTLILAAQGSDGGWSMPERWPTAQTSLNVFRALVKHGILDGLRDLPPLPAGWRVVRSIPAPEGDLWGLAWDGEHWWTCDHEANRAIAVSPVDGEVVQTVGLPQGNGRGLGWWDGALAVTQGCPWKKDPKRLLQVSPNTGEALREIPLDHLEHVGGTAQVNGDLWVVDSFFGWLFRLDSEGKVVRGQVSLAGPLPTAIAADGDAVWHDDLWAPFIIKSGLDVDGRFLDCIEKPFGGSINGVGWDGEHLWVLDNERKRMCAIEKAADGGALSDVSQHGADGCRTVLLDEAVADFRRVTGNLAEHQIVVDQTVYTQPCVYLVMHLIEMRAAGWKEMDFDTLAAVSGASALFAYQPGEFMPKYANLHVGMDDRIADATGFGYEWVSFDSPEEGWALITESIDSGRPLKGWHWENLVIAGYQEAADREDRKVFVMADGPDTIAEWWTWSQFEEWAGEWHHSLGRHAKRVERLPEVEVARRVMRDLVEWSASAPEAARGEYPKAKFGLAGIEAYAADCADVATYEDWSACHDINPQWTVRNSTAAYLAEVAARHVFPAEAAEHISAAAREYGAAYEDWCELYEQLGHGAPEQAGRDPERRAAGAAAVRLALEHEKTAIAELRRALAAID
jgi:hypothetical protein